MRFLFLLLFLSIRRYEFLGQMELHGTSRRNHYQYREVRD
ncbi:unnamed protein product [Haemonchus placei]|uniref:Uncharacterized protein n=1 Tax=Haemonchus placei TaxID=6290 RepID=A0A0N4WKT4_HAEPC|nr:unnamed protein product [Haemonchus placei]